MTRRFTIAFLLLAGCNPGGKPELKFITIKTGIEMAFIPASEFVMGDDAGDDDKKPAHKVQVSAFYMDRYEVTQKNYESLMEKNPSKFKGPDRPVEQVDWYHAALCCNMRSLKEGLKPCYDAKTLACDFTADGYRLPTEAEREYACRAGNEPVNLRGCAWFKANADQTTHPVSQKTPNAWGLFDMHGNVAEWCQDIYSEHAYQNPTPPATGDKRVLRGDSWRSGEDARRSSARASESARFANTCFGSDAYGFRCVRRAP